MDRCGDDPDLRPTGRCRAGAVRADEARAGATGRLDDRDHVEGRDALGDAEDRGDAGGYGLEDRVGGARCRDENATGVRARLGDGFGDRVEDRDAPVEGPLTALAGRHARDDLRPVRLHGPGMELALAAGDPLDDEPGVVADEDAHAALAAFAAATAFAAASSSEDAVSNRAARRRSAASSAFVPTIRTIIGTLRPCWARASMSPRATSSPRVIPPKMFTRMASTFPSARMSR